MKEKMAAPTGGDGAEASARKGKRKVKKKISKAAPDEEGPAARPFELEDLQAFHEEALEVRAKNTEHQIGSTCSCRRQLFWLCVPSSGGRGGEVMSMFDIRCLCRNAPAAYRVPKSCSARFAWKMVVELTLKRLPTRQAGALRSCAVTTRRRVKRFASCNWTNYRCDCVRGPTVFSIELSADVDA